MESTPPYPSDYFLNPRFCHTHLMFMHQSFIKCMDFYYTVYSRVSGDTTRALNIEMCLCPNKEISIVSFVTCFEHNSISCFHCCFTSTWTFTMIEGPSLHRLEELLMVSVQEIKAATKRTYNVVCQIKSPPVLAVSIRPIHKWTHTHSSVLASSSKHQPWHFECYNVTTSFC